MYSKDTVLKNKTGLHARPASMFVDIAKKHTSDITIESLDVTPSEAVNAKSIIMLLTLGLSCGARIRISACGQDERDAVDALVQLIENGIVD